MPDTKPDLRFSSDGVCNACTNHDARNEIDWKAREKELAEILKKHRSADGSHWDCLIPVSGGKDSTAMTLKMLSLDMNPLCVTSTTCDLTEIGRKNIENIKNLGVDYIEFSPNPITRRKLNYIGLTQVGDISWPEHVGIFTIPVRAAVQYKVPLIIWGENSQNEYGGPASATKSKTLDRRWLEEFGGLLGLRVSDLPGMEKIEEKHLIPYAYPDDSDLERVGVTGLFLGHYFPWDGYANAQLAKEHGFTAYHGTVEGSIFDYENLDNYQTGIHDYFKFLKFGFGRATDITCLHIRRNRLSRKEGLELVKKHDGKFPWSYLGKPLEKILKPLDMSIDEFIEVCDRFTNKKLFVTDEKGNLVKDDKGNLTKIWYDNE